MSEQPDHRRATAPARWVVARSRALARSRRLARPATVARVVAVIRSRRFARPDAVSAALVRYGRAARRGLRRDVTGWAVRQAALGLAVVTVALVGVVVGVLLAGRTNSDIGPFAAQFKITPSLTGDSEVDIPPLGSLHLDTHDGPAHLAVSLDHLDPLRTEKLINDPDGVAHASDSAVHDITLGLIKLGLRTLAVAVLAALALSALVFRNTRKVAWSGALALGITLASLATAVGTFRFGAIEEPRYEGLLVNAPAVVGDARRIADQYDLYAAQLQKLVTNVGQIYTTVSTLPAYQAEPGTIRVLHVSDLHLNPTAWSIIRTVVKQFAIEVVIDTGDINDWGSEPESSYVAPIGDLAVPYVFIRGNHDSAGTAAKVASQRNAVVLDNDITTVAGLTIAGISDPRFTPDKQTSPTGAGASKQTVERVLDAGSRLAATIKAAKDPVDIALVHDPASAQPLSGSTPLVLAGHTHKRQVRMLAPVQGETPTRLLVSGSTGGAGLRGLEGEEPVPLSLSILYLDADQRLKAYDDIRVGGTGQSQVTLERHVIDDSTPPAEAQSQPGTDGTDRRGGAVQTPTTTAPTTRSSTPGR